MASYWIAKQNPNGNPEVWMWDCHQCPVVGLAFTEDDTVRDMNAHMEKKHPDVKYSAPPLPSTVTTDTVE